MSPPVLITHRIALQCGAAAKTGDAKNPNMLSGVQYLQYKIPAT
jgi:hypothetical protein